MICFPFRKFQSHFQISSIEFYGCENNNFYEQFFQNKKEKNRIKLFEVIFLYKLKNIYIYKVLSIRLIAQGACSNLSFLLLELLLFITAKEINTSAAMVPPTAPPMITALFFFTSSSSSSTTLSFPK